MQLTPEEVQMIISNPDIMIEFAKNQPIAKSLFVTLAAKAAGDKAPVPLMIQPKENGKANVDITKNLAKTSKICEAADWIVLGIGNDGDNEFQKNAKTICEVIDRIFKENKTLKFSSIFHDKIIEAQLLRDFFDWLHLLKNQWYHIGGAFVKDGKKEIDLKICVFPGLNEDFTFTREDLSKKGVPQWIIGGAVKYSKMSDNTEERNVFRHIL